MEPLLITDSQFQKLLNIGRSAFYKMQSAKLIGPDPIYLSDKKLWNRQEVEDWVNAGCPPKAQWLNRKMSRKKVV